MNVDDDRVAQAMQRLEYETVAGLCEEQELESTSFPMPPDHPHSVHLLGYMYNNQLNDARFLWKRIPDSVKQGNEELCALWKVFQCLWERDYQGAHVALRGHQWGIQVAPFVTALSAKVRLQTLALLTEAYDTIKAADVARFLGMTEAEAVEAAKAKGWAPDDAGMLTVRKPSGPADQKTGGENLQQLVEYIVHLSNDSHVSTA